MAKKEIKEEIIEETGPEEEDEDGIARITAFSPGFEKMLIACIFVMALAIVAGVIVLGAVLYFRITAPPPKPPAPAVAAAPAPPPPPAVEKEAQTKVGNEVPVVLKFPKLPGEGLRYALSLPNGSIGVVVTRAIPAVPGKSAGGTEERLLVWFPEKGKVLRELRLTPPS